MKQENPETPERSGARDEALRLARIALKHTRTRFPGPGRHRALLSTRLSAATLVQALAIAALFDSLLLWGEDVLMRWWDDVILFWAGALGMPVRSSGAAAGLFEWTSRDEAWLMPGPGLITGTAAAVVLVYAASYWLDDALTPLKYPVRALCVVQATAVLVFGLAPSLFTYTIPGHMQAMLKAGYGLMLAVPALLALGYGILRIPALHRIFYPALVLGYFALLVPHQAVLHALVLQHLSVLFMPLLYLCFGVVFDVMVFVALYSWLVSRVPADAVS